MEQESILMPIRDVRIAYKEAFLSGMTIGFCERITEPRGVATFEHEVAIFHKAMRLASIIFWVFERLYERDGRSIPLVVGANVLGYSVGALAGELLRPSIRGRRVTVFAKKPNGSLSKSP